MLLDGSGRTDSAAEQPVTSSSAEQREERMDDMPIFTSFLPDPPRSVFASSKFPFKQRSDMAGILAWEVDVFGGAVFAGALDSGG
jgi:hypothetical protein